MTYTAFCKSKDNQGTTWIQDLEADSLNDAVRRAKTDCAQAWDVIPADIHVLGIAAGNVDILLWRDLP